MNFEAQNFEVDVLKASYQLPVVVDFWAPWCGPCRILGPILEKLAGQSAGRWKLAKWNVDDDPTPAQHYQVRGIPAVKMFIDGQVVAEFAGALPEKQVQKWLDEHIPAEEVQEIDQAIALLDGEEPRKGRKILEKLAKQDPENPQVAFHMGRVLLYDDSKKALNFLNKAAASSEYADEVNYLKRILELIELSKHSNGLEDHPVKTTFSEGLKSLRKKDLEQALQKFIEVVMKNKSYHNEAAREACIGIFFYLGPNHPLTRKYRRRFDMALY